MKAEIAACAERNLWSEPWALNFCCSVLVIECAALRWADGDARHQPVVCFPKAHPLRHMAPRKTASNLAIIGRL